MAWETLPLETDPEVIAGRLIDNLHAAFPGWTAVETSLEVALIEEFAAETAATRGLVVDAADSYAAGVGLSIDGLPAILGTAATLPVAITVIGLGATIPEGLTVVGLSGDGVEVAFTLPDTITAAALTVPAVLVATEPGAAWNGVAGPVDLVTATGTVLDLVVTAASSGGIDPETRTEYLGRLADFRSLLRPGGVRASDLAILARNTAGVHRALALDNYDATTGQSGVERCVSIFPIDEAGAPITPAAKAALRSSLEAVRETNFLIRVADPVYTKVTVQVAAIADDDADPAAVQANVRAALAAALSPATWGTSTSDDRAWTERTTVRWLDLVRAASLADGLALLDSLTLNGGQADVTLAGPAALPAPLTGVNPTTITVTVT